MEAGQNRKKQETVNQPAVKRKKGKENPHHPIFSEKKMKGTSRKKKGGRIG